MSIVTELGHSYFAERFNGAYFRGPEDKMYMIDTGRRGFSSGSNVPVLSIAGTAERVTSDVETLPTSFFTDMAQFKVPRLGWRCAQNGRYLTYLTRNNQSYQRGVCKKNIERTYAPHTDFLSRYGQVSKDYFDRYETTGKLVLDPHYLPLQQGLREMNAGRRLAFAINPDVAVVPYSDDRYALLGMSGMIGTVECATGQIEMTIPLNTELLETT